MRAASLMLVTGISLAGCAAPAAIAPYPAVPPPQAETIPRPPVAPEPLVWQPGHWDRVAGAYAWTGGAWVARAGHGTTWQDGYWTQIGGSWSWVGPHWS